MPDAYRRSRACPALREPTGYQGRVSFRPCPTYFGRISWWPQDRKSTRLNSSHLVISYAVFCLKKKKIRLQTSVLHGCAGANALERNRTTPGVRELLGVYAHSGGGRDRQETTVVARSLEDLSVVCHS